MTPPSEKTQVYFVSSNMLSFFIHYPAILKGDQNDKTICPECTFWFTKVTIDFKIFLSLFSVIFGFPFCHISPACYFIKADFLISAEFVMLYIEQLFRICSL